MLTGCCPSPIVFEIGTPTVVCKHGMLAKAAALISSRRKVESFRTRQHAPDVPFPPLHRNPYTTEKYTPLNTVGNRISSHSSSPTYTSHCNTPNFVHSPHSHPLSARKG
jgi:hypothetical protein